MSRKPQRITLPDFDDGHGPDIGVQLPDFDAATGESSADSAHVELPDFPDIGHHKDGPVLPDFPTSQTPVVDDTTDEEDDHDDNRHGFFANDDCAVPSTRYHVRFDPRTAVLPASRPQLYHDAVKNPDAQTHRADPFHDKLWQHGSQAAWASYDGVVKHGKDGAPMQLPSGVIAKHKAQQMVRYGDHRSQRIAMLSALDSWGTVTAEQMVALTGYRNLLHPDHQVPMSLFSTGLLDIGRLQNSMVAVKDDPRSAVYRHKAPRGRIRRVAKRAWTSAEYLQVDAGVNYQPSLGFMDRHNILGTEFALRCAESHPDVNMIFGEKWSSSDSLLPHTRTKVGFHRTSEQHPVRGDATIVMRDGLRVVVEMTSFHNKSIYKKLNRWAQFLTKHSMAESGVVVMFVMAPSDYTNWRDYESSVEDMRMWMRYVLRRFPSRGEDSAAARMGLARWTDMFPAKHVLSDDFYDLAAEYQDVDWDKKPIGSFNCDFDDPTMASAPIDQGPVLAATPHWWRRGDQTALIGLPSMRAGQQPLVSETAHLTTTGAVTVVHPP